MIAGFTDVLDGVWSFTNGDIAFEDFLGSYGDSSIIALSFNLGATFVPDSFNVAALPNETELNLVFDVVNEGSFVITAVPEPSTFLLLGAGLLGLGFIAKRRK